MASYRDLTEFEKRQESLRNTDPEYGTSPEALRPRVSEPVSTSWNVPPSVRPPIQSPETPSLSERFRVGADPSRGQLGIPAMDIGSPRHDQSQAATNLRHREASARLEAAKPYVTGAAVGTGLGAALLGANEVVNQAGKTRLYGTNDVFTGQRSPGAQQGAVSPIRQGYARDANGKVIMKDGKPVMIDIKSQAVPEGAAAPRSPRLTVDERIARLEKSRGPAKDAREARARRKEYRQMRKADKAAVRKAGIQEIKETFFGGKKRTPGVQPVEPLAQQYDPDKLRTEFKSKTVGTSGAPGNARYAVPEPGMDPVKQIDNATSKPIPVNRVQYAVPGWDEETYKYGEKLQSDAKQARLAMDDMIKANGGKPPEPGSNLYNRYADQQGILRNNNKILEEMAAETRQPGASPTVKQKIAKLARDARGAVSETVEAAGRPTKPAGLTDNVVNDGRGGVSRGTPPAPEPPAAPASAAEAASVADDAAKKQGLFSRAWEKTGGRLFNKAAETEVKGAAGVAGRGLSRALGGAAVPFELGMHYMDTFGNREDPTGNLSPQEMLIRDDRRRARNVFSRVLDPVHIMSDQERIQTGRRMFDLENYRRTQAGQAPLPASAFNPEDYKYTGGAELAYGPEASAPKYAQGAEYLIPGSGASVPGEDGNAFGMSGVQGLDASLSGAPSTVMPGARQLPTAQEATADDPPTPEQAQEQGLLPENVRLRGRYGESNTPVYQYTPRTLQEAQEYGRAIFSDSPMGATPEGFTNDLRRGGLGMTEAQRQKEAAIVSQRRSALDDALSKNQRAINERDRKDRIAKLSRQFRRNPTAANAAALNAAESGEALRDAARTKAEADKEISSSQMLAMQKFANTLRKENRAVASDYYKSDEAKAAAVSNALGGDAQSFDVVKREFEAALMDKFASGKIPVLSYLFQDSFPNVSITELEAGGLDLRRDVFRQDKNAGLWFATNRGIEIGEGGLADNELIGELETVALQAAGGNRSLAREWLELYLGGVTETSLSNAEIESRVNAVRGQ